MTNLHHNEIIYINRINKLSKIKTSRKQLSNYFSGIRLLFFFGCAVIFIFSYRITNYNLTLASMILFILGMFYISKKHAVIKRYILKLDSLICINEIHIKRINGQHKDLDSGDDLKSENHPYAEDLDILGKNSLYQKICSSITPKGRERLKNELCGNIDFTVNTIKQRQNAIEELSNKLHFSQRLIAEGMIKDESFNPPEPLIQWSLNVNEEFIRSFIKPLIYVMSTIMMISLFLPLLINNFSFNLAKIIGSINILLLVYHINQRNEALDAVFQFKKDIEGYSNMVSYIEKTRFTTPYINLLKERLVATDGKSFSDSIKILENIVGRISDRRNIFYLPLNILFLWDYKTCYDLETFKKSYGINITTMLEVIAEFEALISLSNINRDNPNWCTPSFEINNLLIKGKNLSHPLLSHKAVSNNLTIDEKNKIILITGSNMAGKSTMLRTIGANLVLAYTGAKVRGSEFTCSKLKLFTCMRTSDNLEESISSFYAEILRIKALIDLTDRGEKVFFLLDEIFKGTNSIDRHVGAKILIHQLSKKNTLGMVSTHDLELGEIYKENSTVKNYHFKEYYRDNKIFFDYNLRIGISDTRNALYLMKMAGIEVDI
jgi:hypothetical protein